MTWRKGVLRTLLGSRREWRLEAPRRLRPVTPGLHWLGPVVVLASLVAVWPAFSGAVGEHDEAAFALYIGAVAITLMAWSFVLAIRIRLLEPLFGGLDRMYRIHRWCGVLAIAALFLHTQFEPELERGIRGASERIADAATELAEIAELMLYGLVAISLLRWLPSRYWRWTHKLLGVPYAFSCLHFFTAEKTFENSSGYGIWFALMMIVGLVAFVVRVGVRDVVFKGRRYRIGEVIEGSHATELRLEPVGRGIRHRNGQFAFLRFDVPGMREPHPFSIASAPGDGELRFFVKHLGDWSRRTAAELQPGATVWVEGPFGSLPVQPRSAGRVVWIAGGVGITPFLGAASAAPPAGHPVPVLFYAVRQRRDAIALAELEAAHERGFIHLHVHCSAEGSRMTRAHLAVAAGSEGLGDTDVVICGPTALVRDLETAARALGARRVHHEDFDMRQGFGPDLSLPIADLVDSINSPMPR
jgi:predicted ferric reductase